jgi:hypothetical protein
MAAGQGMINADVTDVLTRLPATGLPAPAPDAEG